MKRLTSALDAIFAGAHPGLIAAAVILALLDVEVAAQHLSVSRQETPVAVRTVVVSAETEQRALVIPPELRDMLGHD
jgi:hypothetical protein